MKLNNSNCSVDEKSGAVLVRKSSELQEILRLKEEIKSLKEEIKSLNNKMDQVLELLKGGKKDG